MSENPAMTKPQLSAVPPLSDKAERMLDEVTALGRHAEFRLRTRALLLWMVFVVSIIVLTIWLDWSFRLPIPLWRWGLSLSFTAALVGISWRLLWNAWRIKITPLHTASRIERYFPALGDRLSSAIALVGKGGSNNNAADNPSRSTRLTQLAIEQIANDFRHVDPEDVIDRRPLRFAVLGWFVAFLLTMILLVAKPEVTETGLRRLFTPWAAVPWPQTHWLRLDLPDVVAAGETLPVLISDAHDVPLPSDLKLFFRTLDGSRQKTIPIDVETGQHELTAAETATDFQLRATGGDDQSMAWQTIRTAVSPSLERFTFEVTAPASAGGGRWEERRQRFAVPAGSEIAARFLVVGEVRRLRISDGHSSTPLRQGVSEHEWLWRTVSPLVEGQAVWTVTWETEAGLQGDFAPTFEIDVTADQIPLVRWDESPTQSQVTATAKIPLSFSAADDHGITMTGLVVSASGLEVDNADLPDEPWLFAQPADSREVARSLVLDLQRLVPPRSVNQAGAVEKSAEGKAVDRDASEGMLPDVVGDPQKPVDQWIVWGAATDTAEQLGRSPALILTIIDDQQLQSQLAETAQRSLQRLRQATNSQQVAAERVGEAVAQSDAGAAETSLQIASAAQTQTQRQLEGQTDSALQLARELTQRAAINQVDSPFVQRFAQAIEPLENVAAESIQPAVRKLQSIAQTEWDAQQRQTLQETAQQQAEAARQLQEIGESLEQVMQSQSLAETMRQLAQRQQRIAATTERSATDADAQFRRSLADQQRDLARQFEQFEGTLEDFAKGASLGDQADQWLRQIETQLSAEPVAEQMRQAADDLAANRTASAALQQQELARELRSLAQQLAGDPAVATDPAAGLPQRTNQLAEQQRQANQQMETTLRQQGVESESAIAAQSDTLQATRDLSPDLQSMPVFPEVLKTAERNMESALARMKRDPTDPAAIRDGQTAEQVLREIAQALQQARPEPVTPAAEGQANQGETGEVPSGGMEQLPLPSLFLLRAMQQRLREQTADLAKQSLLSDAVEQADELESRRSELAREQAGLAEQLEKIFSAVSLEVPEA